MWCLYSQAVGRLLGSAEPLAVAVGSVFLLGPMYIIRFVYVNVRDHFGKMKASYVKLTWVRNTVYIYID